MARIKAGKADILWNYVGTIVSMTSGFLLLPVLMRYLDADEIGLWYVYVAIANLCTLFEFGFNPTFARNIVYVVSGVAGLSANGIRSNNIGADIDWHLLNTTIKASKTIYALIALIAEILLVLIGTPYIAFIVRNATIPDVWLSWFSICVAIFLNLYYLFLITLLRGYGDVEGENRAKTLSRIGQLISSAVLLSIGLRLFGATLGYLIGTILMRYSAVRRLRKPGGYEELRQHDKTPVLHEEILQVLRTVSHIAWRDGVVQIALYASTQAMAILSSLFVGLSETGSYSILLQFATAVCNVASAYPKAFFPALQGSFARDDKEGQVRIISSGVVAYWILFCCGSVGVIIFVRPLLPFFGKSFSFNVLLFLFLCIYMGLLTHHSLFCSYIISSNEIPYMMGYIVASVVGVGLSFMLAGYFGLGAWGIASAQFISQIMYNNWRWPLYMCSKLSISYGELFTDGIKYWCGRAHDMIKL